MTRPTYKVNDALFTDYDTCSDCGSFLKGNAVVTHQDGVIYAYCNKCGRIFGSEGDN